MPTTISISTSADSDWIKVFVDGKQVLAKPGEKTVSLKPGYHVLTYFVQGQKGDKYSANISDPPTLAWNTSGVLSSDHSSGQHGFTI